MGIKWKTTSKKIKMEDDLKKIKNGRRPNFFDEKLEWRPQKKGRRQKKIKKWKTTKKEDKKDEKKEKKKRQPKKKWKTNQSTKINLIGCDTIVNSHI